MITKEDVIHVAEQCFDPEIPVDIWNLGLIYDIEISEDEAIHITMSLTAKACPAAQEIPDNLKFKVEELLKPKEVTVEVTFEPAWTPERISEEGKKKLGL